MLTWIHKLPQAQQDAIRLLIKQGYVCPWRYGERVTLWQKCPHQTGPGGTPLRDFSRPRVEVLPDGTVQDLPVYDRD